MLSKLTVPSELTWVSCECPPKASKCLWNSPPAGGHTWELLDYRKPVWIHLGFRNLAIIWTTVLNPMNWPSSLELPGHLFCAYSYWRCLNICWFNLWLIFKVWTNFLVVSLTVPWPIHGCSTFCFTVLLLSMHNWFFRHVYSHVAWLSFAMVSSIFVLYNSAQEAIV